MRVGWWRHRGWPVTVPTQVDLHASVGNDGEAVLALAFRRDGKVRLVGLDVTDPEWEALTNLFAERQLHDGKHRYLSTACLHGRHDHCASMVGYQGVKRPGSCKFCDARCCCRDCDHEPIPVPEVAPPSSDGGEDLQDRLTAAINAQILAIDPRQWPGAVDYRDGLRQAARIVAGHARIAEEGPDG